MAEEAAAARFSEEDFYCPICQEVFKTPVRTMNCQHVWVSLLPPPSFLRKRSPHLLRLPAFISLHSPPPSLQVRVGDGTQRSLRRPARLSPHLFLL